MTKIFTVGVLALQGAFIEHINHFERACLEPANARPGFRFIEVRTEQELNETDALVIPGGESTAIALIAERTGLLQPLMEYVKDERRPVWGTCAGLIFLASEIVNGKAGQQILGGMDIRVKRNAFGRQLDSFETQLDFSSFVPGVSDFPTVFIRAPVVELGESRSVGGVASDTTANSAKKTTSHTTPESAVLSEQVVISTKNTYKNPAPVEILHQLPNGLVVAVRQGNKIGTSFHPELADDVRFHSWVLDQFSLSQ